MWKCTDALCGCGSSLSSPQWFSLGVVEVISLTVVRPLCQSSGVLESERSIGSSGELGTASEEVRLGLSACQSSSE